MKTKKNIKLNLTDTERTNLRKQKVKIADLLDYAVDELEVMLEVSAGRAKELYALADFQQVSSIGIEFAKDLISLGYYTVASLANEDGAKLTDAYEKKKGYKTDVCVEDQFRLAVHVAKTHDYSKTWWDFTAERKQFRAEFGYPEDRPVLNWTDVIYQ